MSIKLKAGRLGRIERDIKILEAERTGAFADVKRLMQKALTASTEADNGLAGASDRMLALIDSAIDKGLDPDTIQSGFGMTAKIAEVLGEVPAMDHAAGLAYELSDMLNLAGRADDAAAVFAIGETINTPANVESWRQLSRPKEYIQTTLRG